MKPTHARAVTPAAAKEAVEATSTSSESSGSQGVLKKHIGSILITLGIVVHTAEVYVSGRLSLKAQLQASELSREALLHSSELSREALRVQQQTTLALMMGEYYTKLQSHNSIHNRLGPNGEWGQPGAGPKTADEWQGVRRYAGLLEQLIVWHRNGIIDAETLDLTYSHRIARIYGNEVIRDALFVKEKKYWRSFNELVSEIWELPGFHERCAAVDRPERT